jgi:hypothetical protein
VNLPLTRENYDYVIWLRNLREINLSKSREEARKEKEMIVELKEKTKTHELELEQDMETYVEQESRTWKTRSVLSIELIMHIFEFIEPQYYPTSSFVSRMWREVFISYTPDWKIDSELLRRIIQKSALSYKEMPEGTYDMFHEVFFNKICNNVEMNSLIRPIVHRKDTIFHRSPTVIKNIMLMHNVVHEHDPVPGLSERIISFTIMGRIISEMNKGEFEETRKNLAHWLNYLHYLTALPIKILCFSSLSKKVQ